MEYQMTITFKETQGYTSGTVTNTFYGISGIYAYEVKTDDSNIIIVQACDVI